jgi:hypothetical protein
MTTIIDPNGTPAPVYTRSGTTIQDVIAAGNDLSTATPIVAVSGCSVVLVATVAFEFEGVILPDDAQIGDVVEVYNVSGRSIRVYAPTGETIHSGASMGISPGGGGSLFRKTTASVWRFVRGD